MLSLTESAIRASFINVSLRERKHLTPPDLRALKWDRLDFLGWRDAKIPKHGYVVTVVADEPVGILLQQADGQVRSRPQCSWCEDVTLPNDVVFFSSRRTGPAGRNGNTIGTLVCSNFECSTNVRKAPPIAYLGFDVDAAIEQRIAALRDHVTAFVTDLRDGS